MVNVSCPPLQFDGILDYYANYACPFRLVPTYFRDHVLLC